MSITIFTDGLLSKSNQVQSEHGFNMFAVHMFQFMETIFVPTECILSIYQDLRIWEKKLGICHRWDHEPSCVFLVTRIFYACKEIRICCWGALALTRKIILNQTWNINDYININYNFKHTIRQQDALDHLLFTLHTFESNKQRFGHWILNVCDRVRIHEGYQKSIWDYKQNIEPFLKWNYQKQLKEYCIYQWIKYTNHQKKLKQWILFQWKTRKQRKKLQFYLHYWIQYVTTKQKQRINIIKKWKLKVDQSKMKQIIIPSIVQNIIQDAMYQSFIQIEYQKQTYQKQIIQIQVLCKWQEYITWKRHIRSRTFYYWFKKTCTNRSLKRPHDRVLDLQFQKMYIHFLMEILIECILFTNITLKCDRFSTIATRLLIGFTSFNFAKTIESSKKASMYLLLRLSEWTSLISMIITLNHRLHPYKSYILILKYLRRAILHYLWQMNQCKYWLLSTSTFEKIIRLDITCSPVEREEWKLKNNTVSSFGLISLPCIRSFVKRWLNTKNPQPLEKILNSLRTVYFTDDINNEMT